MKQLISLFLAAVLLTLTLTVPATAADGFRLIGDVDEDGSVTILDATCIQRSLASLRPLSPLQRYLGDVDGADSVTILDATVIQRA
ncbi:MAG: dockerin type I repeat-containing protein, partial [Ruminococcus sp.]|nr:dockerin type I repeat-containing protein [Ruminococcus sp.]